MGQIMSEYVDELLTSGNLEKQRFLELLKYRDLETTSYLFDRAGRLRDQVHGRQVMVLGRLMISNYCKNECKMCGIRRDNRFVQRFRLSEEQIMDHIGDFYKKGIRSILLESGDDSYLTEELVFELIQRLLDRFQGLQIYLFLGERKRDTFVKWKEAGAKGYYIAHGSENEQHFKKIYPSNMSPLLKKQSLWELKEIGYKIGSYFLMGVPYQTLDHIIEDISFFQKLRPDFLSLGTFLPVSRSVFADQRGGNGEVLLYLLAILRLLLPSCHLFVSPAIDCVHAEGRLTAMDAGADVLLADVSDVSLLESYGIYERKHRRLSLPADDLDVFIRQLETRGYTVI